MLKYRIVEQAPVVKYGELMTHRIYAYCDPVVGWEYLCDATSLQDAEQAVGDMQALESTPEYQELIKEYENES